MRYCTAVFQCKCYCSCQTCLNRVLSRCRCKAPCKAAPLILFTAKGALRCPNCWLMNKLYSPLLSLLAVIHVVPVVLASCLWNSHVRSSFVKSGQKHARFIICMQCSPLQIVMDKRRKGEGNQRRRNLRFFFKSSVLMVES